MKRSTDVALVWDEESLVEAVDTGKMVYLVVPSMVLRISLEGQWQYRQQTYLRIRAGG